MFQALRHIESYIMDWESTPGGVVQEVQRLCMLVLQVRTFARSLLRLFVGAAVQYGGMSTA